MELDSILHHSREDTELGQQEFAVAAAEATNGRESVTYAKSYCKEWR